MPRQRVVLTRAAIGVAGALACAVILRVFMNEWRFLSPWDVERHDKTAAAAFVGGCLAALPARRWYDAALSGAAAVLLGFWLAYVTLDRTSVAIYPEPMVGLSHMQDGAAWMYYLGLGPAAGAVSGLVAWAVRRRSWVAGTR